VESSNVFKIAIKVKSCRGQVSIIKRVLSAYCTIGKSDVYPTLLGNFSRPIWATLLIIDYKISAAKTNNSGDMGSPFLTPLLQ
jgi:hypothetical protein